MPSAGFITDAATAAALEAGEVERHTSAIDPPFSAQIAAIAASAVAGLVGFCVWITPDRNTMLSRTRQS